MDYYTQFLIDVNEGNLEYFITNFSNELNPLNKIFFENTLEFRKLMSNYDLRQKIISYIQSISIEGIDPYDIVLFFASFLKTTIRTTYRPLYTGPDYFIGVDMNINMYCIYYKDLMVIDVDIHKDYRDKGLLDWKQFIKNRETIVERATDYSKLTGDTYVIYESKNGFHVFVVNRRFNKRAPETSRYLYNFSKNDVRVDFNYIVFSYIVGYVVRLNKKNVRDCMYEYIATVGTHIDPELKKLVDLHIEKTDEFFKEYVYMMKRKEN